MQCNDINALLNPYIDGEMTLSETRTLESHVKNCRQCSAKLNEHVALQAAIHNIGEQKVPNKLRKNIDAQLDLFTEDSRSDSKRSWWLPTAIGMTLSSAITAAMVLLFVSAPAQRSLESQFINAHINSLMVNHLNDVVSDDKHTVKPWFSGKIPFSPSVHSDLGIKDLKLQGGRLDYINEKQTASIIYKVRSHVINVFIQKQELEHDTTGIEITHNTGFNIASWNKRGLAYRAVTDLNKNEIQQFSKAYAAQ